MKWLSNNRQYNLLKYYTLSLTYCVKTNALVRRKRQPAWRQCETRASKLLYLTCLSSACIIGEQGSELWVIHALSVSIVFFSFQSHVSRSLSLLLSASNVEAQCCPASAVQYVFINPTSMIPHLFVSRSVKRVSQCIYVRRGDSILVVILNR